ncbi:hypothetical protein IW145_001672 [Coemansia sp. RSA 521]|nr:hypothetical protein GGH15_002277 [Coemansia sp. RSA 562]KAJ2198185.1 hypothetical protein IW144_002049 [Coemansia sp. RSA 522]KAJ2207139.1 hypothetical protein IW145_001672 [Coemansia sp. RSA 521]
MAAPRQLVSYDDLFDEEDGIGMAVEQPSAAQPDNDDDGVENMMARSDAWDDTELIRAWDGTIADYHKFHATILGDETLRSTQRELESKVGQWTDADTSKKRKLEQSDTHTVQHDGQEIANWAAQTAPPQTAEDAMHRLNMAWYYVGYYTACYQALSDGRNDTEAHTSADPDPSDPQDPDP